MIQAVFLDRDGTLVKDYPDAAWADVAQLEFYPDTIAALKRFPAAYHLFIVTNQYLIGENIITMERFLSMHRAFIAELVRSGIQIEQTYFCPHPRSLPCGCHKPETGMIMQCLANYDIDLAHSYVIGDSPGDIALAQAVGCTAIAVRDYTGEIQPAHHAPDLAGAVDFIMGDNIKHCKG